MSDPTGPDRRPGGPTVGTGPSERMVEQPPTDRSSIRFWLLLLGGPVLWAVHFVVVYLVAEAACAAVDTDGLRFMGADALVVSVTAATALGGAGALGLAWWGWRSSAEGDRDAAFAGRGGAALALGSFLAILAVGLPGLVLDPC